MESSQKKSVFRRTVDFIIGSIALLSAIIAILQFVGITRIQCLWPSCDVRFGGSTPVLASAPTVTGTPDPVPTNKPVLTVTSAPTALPTDTLVPSPTSAPAPTPTSTPQGTNNNSYLHSGQILREDASLNSSVNMNEGGFTITVNLKLILQDDGNLVVYLKDGSVLWANGLNQSGGSGATYEVIMQSDGNLVEQCYNTAICNGTSGHPIWDTGTASNPGSYLLLGGNFASGTSGQHLRGSGTRNNPGSYSLSSSSLDLGFAILSKSGNVLVTSCDQSSLCKSA